jgi:hypothetical protein
MLDFDRRACLQSLSTCLPPRRPKYDLGQVKWQDATTVILQIYGGIVSVFFRTAAGKLDTSLSACLDQ